MTNVMTTEPNMVSGEETVMQKVKKRYKAVQAQVETPENVGKFITIDVLSGDYEINRDRAAAIIALRARHTDTQTGTLRVGYTTTYSHGARMQRTV